MHDQEAGLSIIADNSLPPGIDVFESAAIGMVFTDQGGRFRRVNPAFARLLGRPVDDLLGRTFASLTSPEDVGRSESALRDLLAKTTDTARFEKRYLLPDGAVVWVELTIHSVSGPNDDVIGFLTQGVDITARKQAGEAAERNRWMLSNAEHMAGLGSFEQDPAADTIHASHELCDILGLPVGSVLTLAGLMAAVHPDDRSAVSATLGACVVDKIPADLMHRLLLTDGTLRWVHVRAGWTVDQQGRARLIGTVLDISELKRGEHALEHLALYDSLTGLPNRLLVTARLRQLLEGTPHGQRRVAVMMLDLDRFKTVNDSLGHPAGDVVLRQLAERLQTIMRPGDTAGRFAGDEFAVLCDDVTVDQARSIADRLAKRVAEPIIVDSEELRLTVSIGLFMATDSDSPEDSLRDAEAAMFGAKGKGPAHVETFKPSLRGKVTAQLRAEAALRVALATNAFDVHYQPIVQTTTGQVVGAEALLRWTDPQLGPISPEVFVPLAEELGLINELGDWVLRRVCEDLPSLRATGGGALPVSVNLSARQLSDPGLVERMIAILTDTATDPKMLTVEVTETALMSDTEAALAALSALRALGLRVTLDDFGTGYASLTYLKQFPIDEVKIDKSFVSGLGRDAGDTAIVVAVVNLAHSLGMTVVAEGVESLAQRDELCRFDCRFAQGFLWSPAVPVNCFAGVVAGSLPSVRRTPPESPPSPSHEPSLLSRPRLDQIVTGSSDLNVTYAFWRTQVHIGLVVWLLGAAGIGSYVLATPSGPNRLQLGVLACLSVIASISVFWMLGLRLVKTRWRLAFFCTWSLFTMGVIDWGARLDGGASSPIVMLLVLPVLFAALAYPPGAVVVLAAGADALYTLLALSSTQSAASEMLVGTSIGIAGLLMVVGAWNRQVQDRHLYDLATRDGLTRCFTYRAFNDRLAGEIVRARRYGRPLTLLMADVDRLKAINDTLGHAAGDEALASVGKALSAAARELDIVGRLGGDEFAILLPETTEEQAPSIIERVEAAVRDTVPDGVSVSIGAATLGGADGAGDLLRRADQALYAAKRARRPADVAEPPRLRVLAPRLRPTPLNQSLTATKEVAPIGPPPS